MNILVTGHSGFFGKQVSKYLTEQNHIVYGVSRSSISNCPHRQYMLDVTDKDYLTTLTNEKCIDIIVHLAGKPLVVDCALDPFNAFKVNGMGTASILEAARHAKVKKVIVIETDKVYGIQEEIPTTETATLNPASPYELSKVLASMFCDFYRAHYNMDVISVRPVNLFGPGDYSFTRIVPAAMRAIKEGKGIPVQEHAINITRDFIYIDDAVKMLYALIINKTKHSVYNLSSNNTITILEFANQITKILNHNVEPIIIEKPGKYAEIPYQSIDGSRFLDEFDFLLTPFDIAIKETYEKFNLPILGR